MSNSERHLNDLRYQYLKEYLEQYPEVYVPPLASLQTLMHTYYCCRLDGTCAPSGGTDPVPNFLLENMNANLDINDLVVSSGPDLTGIVQSVNPVAQIEDGKLYIFQYASTDFTTNGFTKIGLGDYDFSNPDRSTIIFQLLPGGTGGNSFRVESANGDAASGPFVGDPLAYEGTFLIHAIDSNNRFMAIYDVNGNLINSYSQAQFFVNDGPRKLYYDSYNADTPGQKLVEFWTQESEFPYDITLGDLGTYLTNNPGWEPLEEL